MLLLDDDGILIWTMVWLVSFSTRTCAPAVHRNALRFVRSRFLLGDFRGAFEESPNVLDAHARAGGHGHLAILDGDRRIEPRAVLLGPHLVLLVAADVGHAGSEVQHIDEAEAAGDVDGGGHLLGQ